MHTISMRLNFIHVFLQLVVALLEVVYLGPSTAAFWGSGRCVVHLSWLSCSERSHCAIPSACDITERSVRLNSGFAKRGIEADSHRKASKSLFLESMPNFASVRRDVIAGRSRYAGELL